jgi:hypothetical protein
MKKNGTLNTGLRRTLLFMHMHSSFLTLRCTLVDQDFALRWVNTHVRHDHPSLLFNHILNGH